jgi:hypothetical protein
MKFPLKIKIQIFLLCIIINLIILTYPGCRGHDRMVRGVKWFLYFSYFFKILQYFLYLLDMTSSHEFSFCDFFSQTIEYIWLLAILLTMLKSKFIFFIFFLEIFLVAWFDLLCLMPLSAIFQLYQIILTYPGCRGHDRMVRGVKWFLYFSYFFKILQYFLYLFKISYITSKILYFSKTIRKKFESLFWVEISYKHMTNRCYDLLCLMPLSAIFQLYHGDQF